VQDNSNGRTPLHHLVDKKNYELLEFVLKEARLVQEREFKATGHMKNEVIYSMGIGGKNIM
jgi:glucose-6-phosphate isomerase